MRELRRGEDGKELSLKRHGPRDDLDGPSEVCNPCNTDAHHTALRMERHKMPDSLSAFWRIASFIATKNNRTLLVSEPSVMLRSSGSQLRVTKGIQVRVTEERY